ncbi:hypothetical protein [Occallatibacter riparius]|uniref:Uncharacterized protein n=1 Tax=Occallatibacter riparius TaxID=1002689 RepID=A0A9J7BV74_9BACT|nr:hypothetical protein [Occallatibacter riparius]UWZ86779.1 hypothetical protein MOP44_12715 [Occallatibacter riparius]
MTRIEPPPLATWILEHCIPGQRDGALAGDLLEEFRYGRSNGWYWRQALAALLVGWVRYLGSRSSLIVFAVLWSMLAPAWAVLVNRVLDPNLPWPASVAGWLALNLIFVWTGMLLFAALHRQFSHPFAAKKLKTAFALAAGIFLPTYVATFVLSNLLAWPGLAAHLRSSPLAELGDFRVWADILRLPYFVTLLWSMWSVAPIMDAAPVAIVEWGSGRSAATDEFPAEEATYDSRSVTRMFLFMVGTGLVNAMIAGVLLCRLPDAHSPSIQSVLVRAILYAAIGALAGIMGAYLYWHNPASSFRAHPPLPFPLFALVCAAGWIWIPAILLFYQQVSALSAVVAMLAAFLVAGEIRRIALMVLPPTPDFGFPATERALFAETLYRPPAEPYGYLLALCLYVAGWAIAGRANLTATTLLTVVACVFKLRTTVLPERRFRLNHEYQRAAVRLACLAIPAILITFWALLSGVAHRNHMLAATGVGLVSGKSSGAGTQPKNQAKSSTHVGSGYESVILWPYPPKKEIVAPVEPHELLAPGTTQPLVIRFTGEYWYLQPPDLSPGPHAHRASGSPLDVHIASSNSFPLMMQAHQYLRSPLRIARCRQIRVEVETRETDPKAIVLGLSLKNSSAAGNSAVSLGEQPITAVATANGAPASQTLTFAVPASAKLRSFDEITLMMLTEAWDQRVGPRVAIREFQLVPR